MPPPTTLKVCLDTSAPMHVRYILRLDTIRLLFAVTLTYRERRRNPVYFIITPRAVAAG